jgi:hypothetical protein
MIKLLHNRQFLMDFRFRRHLNKILFLTNKLKNKNKQIIKNKNVLFYIIFGGRIMLSYKGFNCFPFWIREYSSWTTLSQLYNKGKKEGKGSRQEDFTCWLKERPSVHLSGVHLNFSSKLALKSRLWTHHSSVCGVKTQTTEKVGLQFSSWSVTVICGAFTINSLTTILTINLNEHPIKEVYKNRLQQFQTILSWREYVFPFV